MYKARYCPYCKENRIRENDPTLRYPFYYRAYFITNDDIKCSHCNNLLIKMNLTNEEFNAIVKVSSDPNFIESMDKLKEKDIIEFNLKMSQFKSQIGQSSNTNKSTSNNPKCPNCSSTNINPISGLNRGVSVAMWGIFSKKINKSYECKNCGYTW